MNFEPIPDAFQDSRCQVGAKVSDYEHLYEVVDRRISGSSVACVRFWVRLEDCSDLDQFEVEAGYVRDYFFLVEPPVRVPDFPPAVV